MVYCFSTESLLPQLACSLYSLCFQSRVNQSEPSFHSLVIDFFSGDERNKSYRICSCSSSFILWFVWMCQRMEAFWSDTFFSFISRGERILKREETSTYYHPFLFFQSFFSPAFLFSMSLNMTWIEISKMGFRTMREYGGGWRNRKWEWTSFD